MLEQADTTTIDLAVVVAVLAAVLAEVGASEPVIVMALVSLLGYKMLN